MVDNWCLVVDNGCLVVDNRCLVRCFLVLDCSVNKLVKGWSLEFFNHSLHVGVSDVMNLSMGFWLEKVDGSRIVMRVLLVVWSMIVRVSLWHVNRSESHRVVVVWAQIMFHLCCVVMAV
jgi:hypothetical protein